MRKAIDRSTTLVLSGLIFLMPACNDEEATTATVASIPDQTDTEQLLMLSGEWIDVDGGSNPIDLGQLRATGAPGQYSGWEEGRRKKSPKFGVSRRVIRSACAAVSPRHTHGPLFTCTQCPCSRRKLTWSTRLPHGTPSTFISNSYWACCTSRSICSKPESDRITS